MRRELRRILPDAQAAIGPVSPRASFGRATRFRDTGQGAVEFVLTILFIMVLIFWALEIIMFVYSYSVLADAAKEGVRYAVVHGSASGSPSGPATGSGTDCSTNVATVQGIVQNYARLTFHNMSGMTVNVCYLDGNNEAPNRVQIRVSYPYSTFFTFWRPPTIRAAAEGRIMF